MEQLAMTRQDKTRQDIATTSSSLHLASWKVFSLSYKSMSKPHRSIVSKPASEWLACPSTVSDWATPVAACLAGAAAVVVFFPPTEGEASGFWAC